MTTRDTKWFLIVFCGGYILFCFVCYYATVISSKALPQMESKHGKYSTIEQAQYEFHEPFSKDLIVHDAFFDSRPREGHINLTVILITVNKTILDKGWIVGCGIGGKNCTNVSIYSGLENSLMHKWLGNDSFLYENMRVHCYDMPGTNGSEVHVVCKTGPSSPEIREISQHPLFFPAPRVTPTGKYNFTTVTCSKIHNRKASFIHEFVQYQKTLG